MIRRATPDDVTAILGLIHELAAYERAPDEVHATADDLHASLFCAGPAAFAHVAEHDGEVVGFALWFLNYSTWLGRHGIYLEDLYVRPAMRGQGYGRALLTELARIAVENGYGRMEWWVLDWNEPAIEFYSSIGAVPMDEWIVHRVTGDALHALAGSDPLTEPQDDFAGVQRSLTDELTVERRAEASTQELPLGTSSSTARQ